MRTFGWPDTKWLCQKSVIRSVSGERVDQHLLDPPRAKREAFAHLRLRRTPCAPLGRAVLARRRAAATCRRPMRAAASRAVVRVSRSSLATAASRVSARVRADFRVRRSEARAREQVPRVVVAEHRARSECRRGMPQSASKRRDRQQAARGAGRATHGHGDRCRRQRSDARKRSHRIEHCRANADVASRARCNRS